MKMFGRAEMNLADKRSALCVERVSPTGMIMQYGSHLVSSRTARRHEVEGGNDLGAQLSREAHQRAVLALRDYNQSASRNEVVHQPGTRDQ